MTHARKISITGLGYVGLPVAVAFGRKTPVVGFDVDDARVRELQRGHDRTGEVSADALATAAVRFTSDPEALRAADFHVVAVPTPVDDAKRPDLGPILRASATLGAVLKRGDIVVFESTVYPGATEEECVPVLERASGLVCGRDFTVGYSPERINPGDRTHRFETVKKVVSGLDAATLDVVARVYESVVDAGVHRAPTIRTAEAAKVIENTQRDLNIALMNELAVVFKRLGIDTLDVLEAAGTKWNFLPFRPGLVGGHCIGVDPYYLTYKAQSVGYHPEVILAGRRINDEMGRYVAREAVRLLVRDSLAPASARVGVLGLTFKEDCADLRNTRVVDLLDELGQWGVRPIVVDPVTDADDAQRLYGLSLAPLDALVDLDAVIIAVAHGVFRALPFSAFERMLRPGGRILDVKGIIDRDDAARACLQLYRL